MKIAEPSEVVEVRKKLIQEMIQKYKFSELELAEYFCSPVTCIRRDLKELGVETPSKKSTLDVERLTAQRDRKLKKALETSQNQSEALKSFGLWRMPKDLQNPSHKDDLILITEENKKNVYKAMSLIELGFSVNDAYVHLGMDNMGRLMIEQITQQDGLHGRNRVQADQELQSYVDEVLEEHLSDPNFSIKKDAKALATDISRLTGSGYRMVYDRAVNIRNNVENPDPTESLSAHQKLKNKIKMEKANEIYEKWSSSQYTQQELANEYNLSRATVMNYIKFVKADRIEEISRNIPTVRRRNVAEKQREKNKELVQLIHSKYDELVISGVEMPSANRISKETGIGYNVVAKVMKKEGLMSSSYNRCKLQTLEDGSKLAEGAYSMGAHASFGYGPNAGTVKNGTWREVYQKQAETNTALRVDPSLREHFNRNFGSIIQYYIPSNTRARNELNARKERKKLLEVSENEMEM